MIDKTGWEQRCPENQTNHSDLIIQKGIKLTNKQNEIHEDLTAWNNDRRQIATKIKRVKREKINQKILTKEAKAWEKKKLQSWMDDER